MSLNDLEQSDIDTLVELLLRRQQSRERKALCINIGIDHKRLNFLENTSVQDFFIRLIHDLHQTDNNDAFCKLCCKELLPSCRDQESKHFLVNIIEKLGCHQSMITSEPIPVFQKQIRVISAIFVIVLTAIIFLIYNQISGNTLFKCLSPSFNSFQKPSSTTIQIVDLHNDTCVEKLLIIKGKVTVQDADKVWFVVYPLVPDSKYYVQKPANIENGQFAAEVNVGDEKTASGTKFVIRAFVKPNNELVEADILYDWPKAKWSSDIISVMRK